MTNVAEEKKTQKREQTNDNENYEMRRTKA